MNIKVVTSLIGTGRDSLKDNLLKEENTEYIAYTNHPSNEWTLKSPCTIFNEDKKNAKIHKILIHKYEECDVSIWIDANTTLLHPPSKIVENLLGDNDMAICMHPSRTNIFDEAAHIVNIKFEYADIVERQLKRYEHVKEEMLQEDKLYFATTLIRRHTPKVNAFNEAWWAEICPNSFRDQLSLPYVLRQHDLKINFFTPYDLLDYYNREHHAPITFH
jgi:hypothetical protein